MKKIVINGKFLCQRITGVQRYAREIINELDKIIEPDTIELLIPKVDVELPNYKNIKIIKYGKFKNNLWEQISLPKYVKKNKALCYSLCNVSPLKCPDIVTIFDMKIFEHPEFFSKKFVKWYRINLKNSILKSKLIFTDSIFAKNEIIRFFPSISEDKIVVTYCGYEHFNRITYDEFTLSKYELNKNNYYFALGSLDPNKNFEYIAKIAKKNNSAIFAIAGAINESVFNSKFGYEVPNNMKFLGFVTDSEAKTLMRDSKAFLFPSIYEGFGIPPLEAISSGCQNIVVSNIPSMKEIYGNFVTYFSDDLILNTLKSCDFSNFDFNKFSWETSSKIVYKNLMSILCK